MARLDTLLAFVLARMREPGSQRAIAMLAGLAGVTVTDRGWSAALWTVATLSALAAVLLPERHTIVVAAAAVEPAGTVPPIPAASIPAASVSAVPLPAPEVAQPPFPPAA